MAVYGAILMNVFINFYYDLYILRKKITKSFARIIISKSYYKLQKPKK